MTTYKEAGVDVNKNDILVDKIKQITGISTGFADSQMIGDQFISMSCDGVGTKIKLARYAPEIYDTIGDDLVGMCANDLICAGAEPTFFLDYIGMNNLESAIIERVIASIHSACARFGMRVVGGEMAEMPNTYVKNLPELVGVAIGFGDLSHKLNSQNVKSGDKIIGLPSSGPHSNGYSLINKILEENIISEDKLTNLTAPTTLYTKVGSIHYAVPDLINAIAHITGGGLKSNLQRALPEGLEFELNFCWEIPEIFEYIAKIGEVDSDSMWTTFNMGIGMCLIVDPDNVKGVSYLLKDYDPIVIGEVG